MAEVIEFIKNANPVLLEKAPDTDSQKKEDPVSNDYTKVEFEDLDDNKE